MSANRSCGDQLLGSEEGIKCKDLGHRRGEREGGGDRRLKGDSEKAKDKGRKSASVGCSEGALYFERAMD